MIRVMLDMSDVLMSMWITHILDRKKGDLVIDMNLYQNS